ncbi:MAG: hypothetical protein KBD06_05395 [Candidatus Pacebacteria bacterium]|nr:hypothetical protein [Candidatus Paceibacterota bacterium]
MRALRRIGFWTLMAASVPFAFWFWMYVVDVPSYALSTNLWQIDSLIENKSSKTGETESIEMVSSLTYTDAVQCTMTVTIVTLDGNALIDIRYKVETPSILSIFSEHIRNACMVLASGELHRLADAEESQEPNDNKI